MFINQQQFIGMAMAGLAAIVPLVTTNTNSDAIAQSINLDAFRSTALSKHNGYRNVHSSPAMGISSSLNSSAQAWADRLASTGTFAHSQKRGVGENLYVYYTTANSIASDTLARGAVDDWYNEVKQYNYASPRFSSATGHFTQVVWKNSTQLGCGASRGVKTMNGRKFNAFYVVCQYNPPGNVSGQFPNNVLKPR